MLEAGGVPRFAPCSIRKRIAELSVPHISADAPICSFGGEFIDQGRPNRGGGSSDAPEDGSDVRIYSKNGAEWTQKLPAMVEAFRGLRARSAILDGELCHSGASGRPDFRTLMREMRSSRPDPFHLVVYAFDLLHLNGADLRLRPFHERRQKLVGLDKPLSCLFVTAIAIFAAVWIIAFAGFWIWGALT